MHSKRVTLCLGVERSCRRKHDGGVKVTNDAADNRGGINTGLRSSRALLESSQHIGDLQGHTTYTALKWWPVTGRSFKVDGVKTLYLLGDTLNAVHEVTLGVGVSRVGLNSASILYSLRTRATQISDHGPQATGHLSHTDRVWTTPDKRTW